MEQVHATCVAADGAGVLLRGEPGSGKSDLALRLIDGGARLVADDRVDLALDGGAVVASAPTELTGLIEVRGVGVLTLEAVDRAAVRLVVDLVRPEDVARIPEPGSVDLLGIRVPGLRLAPFEASAAAKVRAALGQQERL